MAEQKPNSAAHDTASSHGEGSGHGKSGHKKKHGGHGHGGGHEEGHEGAPEWLISFADNVMLQMGFFVILLALTMKELERIKKSAPTNSPQESKQTQAQSAELLDAAIGIRAAFNNPVRLDSVDPRDRALIARILERRAKGEGEETGPEGGGQKVQAIRPSDYRALSGAVFFEENGDQLSEDSLKIIADIAQRSRGLRLVLEIRGHSSAAEAYQQANQAIRLSFDRAMNVAKALAEQGIDWRQLRLIASGDNDRLKSTAYDKAEQRQNQRVEVIVTNELVKASP